MLFFRYATTLGKQKKTALANRTIYSVIWYAFYDLQPGVYVYILYYVTSHITSLSLACDKLHSDKFLK